MRARHTQRWAAVAAIILLAPGCADQATEGGDVLSAPSSAPPPPIAAETTNPDGAWEAKQRDNRGWRQRHELSPAEERAGQQLAARIRPELEALRAAGDLTPAAIRRALLDLGLDEETVLVRARSTPIGEETPAPGAVYAVDFGEVGCVIGDVRPDRVLIEVTGSAAEFGCLEPSTH